jgi:hypothetical protein
VRDLESLAASAADPDAVLQRCDEIRPAVRGSAHEPRLLAVETRAREQKRARDRDRQVTTSIGEARRIMNTPHLAERKDEVLALLNAAREVAGPRRDEVDRVLGEVETRLKAAPAPGPAPAPVDPPSLAVTAVTLLNAETDKPIAGFDPIPPGAVLNFAALGTRQLNVLAQTAPERVGSVKFELNGKAFRVEDVAPYSLAGDVAGDYWPWTPAPGKYTLTVTPYASAKAAGGAGTPLSVTFEIVEPVAGPRITAFFQDGVAPSPTYNGTRDAPIVEASPERYHGVSAECRVVGDHPPGQKKQRSTLLQWDLTSIPPGSTVHAAALTLVSTDGDSDAFDVYEAKRPWIERQVTWVEATKGRPWELPGAKGPQDRGTASLGQVKFKASTSATFELNPAGVAVVQSWVDTPSLNNGFIIAGDKKDDADFASREHAAVANRPKLMVVFSKETGPAAAAPPPGSHSFQDGTAPDAAYLGTRDASVVESQPGDNSGASRFLKLGGDHPARSGKDAYALVRWDVSSVARGTLLRAASVTLWATAPSPEAFDVFGVRRPWNEKWVTWNEFERGKPWEGAGGKGTQDRTAPVGQVAFPNVGAVTFELNAAGVALVQGWINDPATNHGLLIGHPDREGGVLLASREAFNPSERPRLNLYLGTAAASAPPPAVAAARAEGPHELEATGLIRQWLVLGPFGNRKEPEGMWDHDLLRKEEEHVPAPGLEVATREGTKVRWAPAAAPDGDLLFHKVDALGLAGRTQEPAIAFAACWLELENETDLKFRINADQGYRFWLDHKIVGSRINFPMSGEPETYRMTLAKGTHLVLIKAATIGNGFGLRMRVTTPPDMRVRAPGVRVWTRAPEGARTGAAAAAPARKVLLAESFDAGPGKFEGGEVADGAYAFTKAAWVNRRFEVTPALTVRFRVKPLADVKGLAVISYIPKLANNCWYHIRGAKKNEWTAVEYKVADTRAGWNQDGPGPAGETAENVKIYFDYEGSPGKVLIDDFELVDEPK